MKLTIAPLMFAITASATSPTERAQKAESREDYEKARAFYEQAAAAGDARGRSDL